MSRMPWIGLALVVVLAGCGGGGASTTLPAPSDLVTTPGSTPDALIISWLAPPQAPNGYELQGKGPGMDFTQITSGLIPASYTSVVLNLNTLPPEGTRFTFRVRASFGGQWSSYSNEATYESGPNAPLGLEGAYDLEQGGVALSWTRNSTMADGCRLERATSDGNGQVTSEWSALAGVDPTASSHLDASAAQGSYYLYRITNLKGGVASASATSPVLFAGRSNLNFIAANYYSDSSNIYVFWSWSTSVVSSKLRVRIERAESDVSGNPTGAWTSVATVDALATSYRDPITSEDTYLMYRATPFQGSTDGITVTARNPAQTPLKAPGNLRLTATDKGIRLDWENQSRVATEVMVRRSPSVTANGSYDLALLSASTNTFEDTGLPVGYYTYWVVARKGTMEATSTQVTAPTANPANALRLTAGALQPPLSCGAVRLGGAWAFGVSSPLGVYSKNDPWPSFFPSGALLWNPDFIKVDPQGNPHIVYPKVDAFNAGQFIIVHAWFDGTAWKTEDVVSTNLHRSGYEKGFEFALDTVGGLHLLLDHSTSNDYYGGSTETLTYIHKSGGAYLVEPLSAICNRTCSIGSYHIQLDGQDRPHLLLGVWDAILDCTKDKDGAWGVVTLPTGSLVINWKDFLDARWVDPENGWVFFGSRDTLMGLQCMGGAWQAPVPIADNCDGGAESACVALSLDGTRLVIHHHGTLGERLFHLTPGGWVGTLLGPMNTHLYNRRIPMGFDAAQKLHLLLPTSDGTQSQEFKEP